MDPYPDPGGPKTCGSGGSGFGSEYATLHTSFTSTGFATVFNVALALPPYGIKRVGFIILFTVQ
jgi:hypothetical protein